MSNIIRCQDCGKSLHSLRSRKKELCAPCERPAHSGGMSAAEKWMRGVQNA